jgi:hypothetical protein
VGVGDRKTPDGPVAWSPYRGSGTTKYKSSSRKNGRRCALLFTYAVGAAGELASELLKQTDGPDAKRGD